jgi:hypothetical protein
MADATSANLTHAGRRTPVEGLFNSRYGEMN